jgi:hypothetical protein
MRRPINWITVCISMAFLVVGLSLAEPRQHRDVQVVAPAAFPVLEQTAAQPDPFAFAPRIAAGNATPEIDNATLSYSITFETADPLDVRELTAALEPRRR